jgi:hypothetical protein
MPSRRNNPATVQEALDPTLTFRPAALGAVESFARSKPWQGPLMERKAKLRRCFPRSFARCRPLGHTLIRD